MKAKSLAAKSFHKSSQIEWKRIKPMGERGGGGEGWAMLTGTQWGDKESQQPARHGTIYTSTVMQQWLRYTTMQEDYLCGSLHDLNGEITLLRRKQLESLGFLFFLPASHELNTSWRLIAAVSPRLAWLTFAPAASWWQWSGWSFPPGGWSCCSSSASHRRTTAKQDVTEAAVRSTMEECSCRDHHVCLY